MPEKEQEKERLILPIMGRMDYGTYPLYWLNGNDEIATFDGMALARAANTLSTLSLIQSKEEGKKEENLMLGATRDHFDDLLSRLTPNERAIFELVFEGRIKLSLLIDSTGGRDTVGNTLLKFVQFVSLFKGEVHTWGGQQIASAAAMIFMAAPNANRRLLDESKLMLHLSTDVETLPPSDDDAHRLFKQKRLRQIEQMRALLLAGVVGKFRYQMEKRIKDAFSNTQQDNPDLKIILNGSDLNRYGLGATVQDLEEDFKALHHLHPDAYSNTKIADFFLPLHT